jgi:hypothetical protein
MRGRNEGISVTWFSIVGSHECPYQPIDRINTQYCWIVSKHVKSPVMLYRLARLPDGRKSVAALTAQAFHVKRMSRDFMGLEA